MDSKRDLRSEFQRALEAVTPPAPWLRVAVNKELRNSLQSGWWRMHAGSLVAAALVVLILAVLVVGLEAWRNGVLNPSPVPAGEIPTINGYQTLVNADDLSLDDISMIDSAAFGTSVYTYCASLSYPNCLPAVAVANAAAQQWLDDLNRTQPPTRFAAVHALLRRHLTLLILDNAAFVSAYKANDQDGRSMTSTAANSEESTLNSAVAEIDATSQGTTAQYKTEVQVDNSGLHACALCQPSGGLNQVSCRVGETPACAGEIAGVRVQVEAFIEDLVKVYAPDSMAARDATLQSDLMAATVALDALESALSSGGQAALQAGLDALHHALAQVDLDAASIAASG